MFATVSLSAQAENELSIDSITAGAYNAEYISGINPVKGTDEYTQISLDGKRIEKYSFKTGKLTGVLFDINNVKGMNVKGIDGYIISPDGKSILIETQTERIYRRSFVASYYIYHTGDATVKQLSAMGKQQIPTFSPDSKHIAFVRNNNIFVTDGEKETMVTHDGETNRIINGIPDWVNEEEFGTNCSLAWSADGRYLNWIRYDESGVRTYSLQLFQGMKPERKENADYPGDYAYKYPKAGQDNSIVSAWSYDIETGHTMPFQLPLAKDGYIPRILTIPAKKGTKPDIMICTMNRHQDSLRIYKAKPEDGVCQLIIEENVPGYVKEEVLENMLLTPEYILLPSDRDGFMHTYLYNYEGKLIRQIDKGEFETTGIYGFDEKSGPTYIQAAAPTPSEREIYAIDKTGRMKMLSGKKGWNSAIFSDDMSCFVNTWSDADTPYLYSIIDNKGKSKRTIADNSRLTEKLGKHTLGTKSFFQFETSEGVKLNGWMVKPANFNPQKKYPVIMFQYSGPGSQQVVNRWSIGSMGNGALYDLYLAQEGFIVVCVDGRGTGGRGAAFEKCTFLNLGVLESRDQVETAIWLAGQNYVDKDRIGIWGWSFGGFNTLMSMSEGRDVFKAGVAVAPPTNWKFYDTIYTERYMHTPSENPSGYSTNPIERAPNLHGALLICHGLADDNVHPQNTFEYSEALVQNNKDFQEIIYTNRNHSIYGGNTRNHLLRQIALFLKKNL